jgi:hypothetical protein
MSDSGKGDTGSDGGGRVRGLPAKAIKESLENLDGCGHRIFQRDVRSGNRGSEPLTRIAQRL